MTVLGVVEADDAGGLDGPSGPVHLFQLGWLAVDPLTAVLAGDGAAHLLSPGSFEGGPLEVEGGFSGLCGKAHLPNSLGLYER